MTMGALERRVLGWVPALPPVAQHVLVTTVWLLAEGEPVALPRVAAELGLRVSDVEVVVARLRTAARDSEGRVTSCIGLTVERTQHQVVIGDRELHAWCAWDVLLLPSILRVRLDCLSPCPVTGEQLEVSVEPTGEVAARPLSTVMTLADIDLPPAEELRASFCDVVRFVSDEDVAARWAIARDDVAVLQLGPAARLARAVGEACCPDVHGG